MYIFNYEFIISSSVSSTITTNINVINLEKCFIFEEKYTLLFFIPLLLTFEVIFDFFHYFAHYLEHKYFYKFHKIHHKYYQLTPIIAFYIHPIDTFISIFIPFTLSTFILRNYISPFTLHLILIHKCFMELEEHSSNISSSLSCFPLITNSNIVNIGLFSQDHGLHHKLMNYNYGKRFTLWDKIFKTYRQSSQIQF